MGVGTTGTTTTSWPSHWTTTVIPPTPNFAQVNLPFEPDLLGMIRSRFRLSPGEALPFDHIYCVKKKNDVVLVLVVNGDQHVILEDGYELFPSDGLVTSLRLLAK